MLLAFSVAVSTDRVVVCTKIDFLPESISPALLWQLIRLSCTFYIHRYVPNKRLVRYQGKVRVQGGAKGKLYRVHKGRSTVVVYEVLGGSGELSKWLNNPYKPYSNPSYPHY